MGKVELRSDLRAQTRDLHQKLERQSVLSCLARPGLDARDYTRVMGQLAMAYTVIDPAINAAEAGWGLPYADLYRPRSPALAYFRPLTQGGAAVPSLEIEASEYFGARYVIEGSSLGARVILENLKQCSCDLDHTFWVEQVAAGDSWPRFCRRLNSLELSRNLCEGSRQGARKLFAFFLTCLVPQESLCEVH